MNVVAVMHLGQMVETAGLQQKACVLVALLLESLHDIRSQANSDSKDG